MATTNTLCKHDITPTCPEISYAKCPHCSLDLCLEHMLEHQDTVRIQFGEMIDRINEQKAESDNHSIIYEIKTKAVIELDKWREAKIKTVMTTYDAERARIENVCDKSITDKCEIQNTSFEELNVESKNIEKKKIVHPLEIKRLEQKLNELINCIQKIEKDADVQVAGIVKDIKLPETIELEHRLKEITNEIDTMKREYQLQINTSNNIIEQLQRTINEKDTELTHIKRRVPSKYLHRRQVLC